MQPNTPCTPQWFEDFQTGQVFATGGMTYLIPGIVARCPLADMVGLDVPWGEAA